MPHVDGDTFAKLAHKRRSSLPHKGEFHVGKPPKPQPQTRAHTEIEEKIKEHAADGHHTPSPEVKEHVNPYGHNPSSYHSEPDLTPPSMTVPHKTRHASIQPQPPTVTYTHTMTRGEKTNFIIMRTIGNFLLFFSLYGVAATFGPALYFEGQYRVAQARGIEYTVKDPLATLPTGSPTIAPSQPVPTTQPVSPGFGSVLAGAEEQVLVPPDTEFSVVIPKIGATSKVYPNVDPLNESDFLPKLQSGVAHAKGTVFPGMQGNTYLFAHSTDNFWNVGRYNAVFYLLKELQPGDEVIVFFEGKRHNYKVERTEIRDASDVELLVESQKAGREQLIMQTCWPPGTTWKRMFVIATPQ